MFSTESFYFPAGSFELRAGFAIASTSAAPSLSMENIVSKFRERKTNVPMILAGADCFTEAQSRAAIRSPFDGDIVTNLEIMVGSRLNM